MEQAPMISSTSPRSPQKTCGLFDIGFAGGDLDVTSLDLSAPAELISSPFSLKGLKSVNFTASDAGGDAFAHRDLDSMHQYTMDTFDMLEPLADLETDQLMNDSLDAFVNLEQFLMGDTFLDEPAEVKPFINVSTFDNITLPTPDAELLFPSESNVLKSRKRKTTTEPSTAGAVKTSMFEIPVSVKPVKTSLFEISVPEKVMIVAADPQLDHDYTAKHQRLSSSLGDNQKSKNIGNSKVMSTAKTLSHCQPSTSELVSCSEEIVSDKQAVRRMKNNVASKKSREQRKQKFAGLDQEAEALIKANEELRRKIVELEKMAKEMKALLVAKMTGH